MQKIFTLLLNVISIHLNLAAQVDPSTNYIDWYESQSGEEFKLISLPEILNSMD